MSAKVSSHGVAAGPCVSANTTAGTRIRLNRRFGAPELSVAATLGRRPSRRVSAEQHQVGWVRSLRPILSRLSRLEVDRR